MADITDIRQVRRNRKKIKILKRVILISILIILCFFGFLYREQIREIFENIGNNISITQNASGYPQLINGTQVEKVLVKDEKLAILSDMSLAVYSDNGTRVTTIQHSFNNPDVSIRGKYILLFNRGGNKISLYTKDKEIYTITTDFPIVEATVSTSGKVAIATASEKNNTMVVIYEKSKAEILKWNSSHQVTSLDFSSNDNRLIVASVHTKSGILNSDITVLESTSSKPVFEKTLPNLMVLRIAYNSQGNIFVIGDSSVMLLSAAGETMAQNEYNTTLTAFSMSEDALAIFEGENEVISGGTITGYDVNLKPTGQFKIDNKIRSLNIAKDKITFVTDRMVYGYSLAGEKESEFTSDGKYINAVFCNGKYIAMTSSRAEELNVTN